MLQKKLAQAKRIIALANELLGRGLAHPGSLDTESRRAKMALMTVDSEGTRVRETWCGCSASGDFSMPDPSVPEGPWPALGHRRLERGVART